MRLGLIFLFVTKLFRKNNLLTMLVDNNLDESNTLLKSKKIITLQKITNNTNQVSDNSTGDHINGDDHEYTEKMNNRLIKIHQCSSFLKTLHSKDISNNCKINFINENDILPIKLYNLNASGLWKDWDFDM
jgi:hypothetical protein